jgi:hypothetical protein
MENTPVYQNTENKDTASSNTLSNNELQKFLFKDRNINFMNLLALILILYSMWYFGTLLFITVPKDNVRFVDTIIGFLLGSVVGVIVNYYYGAAISNRNISIPNNTVIDDTKDSNICGDIKNH